MPDDNLLDELLPQDRVLISAELHLANGSFFQPTGFPDIGACIYTDGKGKRRCLVESEQSMANRLEAVCMKAPGVWREPLAGKLPVIRVEEDKKNNRLLATTSPNPTGWLRRTCSRAPSARQRSRRRGRHSRRSLKEHFGLDGDTWPLDKRESLAQAVFALDPAAILHGFQFMQWEAVGLRASRLLHARLRRLSPTTARSTMGSSRSTASTPGRRQKKGATRARVSLPRRATCLSRFTPPSRSTCWRSGSGLWYRRPTEKAPHAAPATRGPALPTRVGPLEDSPVPHERAGVRSPHRRHDGSPPTARRLLPGGRPGELVGIETGSAVRGEQPPGAAQARQALAERRTRRPSRGPTELRGAPEAVRPGP